MSSFERRDERRGRIGALFEVIVIEFRIAWIGPLLLAALGALAGGCGGSDAPRCEATFTAWAGAACGPCALDTLRCVDGALVCDGATDCSYGDACTDSDACDQGICTEGRCAPEGMAFIPGGTFLMGSPPFELGRIDSEPEHPVRLSRHYFMDRTETTQADFERLMGFQPSHFTACGPDCPAENMLWLEALSYANARSAAEGLPPCYDLTACRGAPGTGYFQCDPPIAVDLDCRGYRLPTEAEWEHAYRAETRTAYYNGSTESFDTCQQPLLEEIARFCGNCSASYGQPYDCSMGGARPDQPTDCGPGPVGGYAPNPWGLYDMSGNIAEMVWDAHGPYERYAIDPIGPPQDGYAMLRGAGFCGHMARLRASDRKFTTWTAAHPSRGFRLVRSYREAAAGETVGDDVCDNGCGGCGPLPASPGTPCGPCGADRYVCTSEESTECSGNTTGCEFGSPCAADAECVGGHCSNGHCAPGGFEYIPSGLFQMGSPGSEPLRDVDELYHDVGLRRPYLMQSHEVTREQWHSLIGVHRGSFEACGTDCPIETVNRWDAMIYANTQSRIWGLPECYDLSACDGEPGSTLVCPVGIGFDVACEGFRLPTEAEWERAYRAGTETIFYNGTTSPAARCDQPLLLEIAHFCGNCDAPYPRGIDCSATGGFANCGPGPVGRFAPNDWGLYDMAGNVSEIVFDNYDAYPDFILDPIGPLSVDTEQYVARGGGFCSVARRLRAADRHYLSRTARVVDVGFRLARSLPLDPTMPVCDNACGGCRPVVPAPGTPCGPCLIGQYVCTGVESSACEPAGSCPLGAPCADASECAGGECLSGFCTAPGFAYIPPGTFMMGSAGAELGRRPDEVQHEVTLTRGVLMQRREVTQAEWRLLMDANPSRFASCGDDCPVETITWLQALVYANALSRLHGFPECYDLSTCTGSASGGLSCPFELAFSLDCAGYRLPTEAEWERAYRAETTTAFYSGEPTSALLCDQPLLLEHAQFCGNCEIGYADPYDCSATGGFATCGTTTIGSRMPNPWGLYDMSGNVGELVWDVLEPYPATPAVDPIGPIHSGQNNIARGGGFCGHMARLRAADRRGMTRVAAYPDVGLRLVRTVL